MKLDRFYPRVLLGGVVALFLALVLFLTPAARAQSPTPIIVPVALAPLARDTPIELTALTLDADISEIQGHTIISGNSTFKLHNTDRLTDLQVAVGFPTWAGDPYAFDPARFDPFSVSVDGIKVRTLNPGRADLKIGNTTRTVDWYTFTLTIAADEKKIVRYDFQQALGDGTMPRFTYGLFPALNWKGSIGSARLTLNFPGLTALEQIVAYDPPNPQFDGQSLTWLFASKEPAASPTLTFLRMSLWNELLTKRRDAQQNSNNANARLALGNLLRQLAQSDSPRRDSFYGQAAAELEVAVRLDPNNRAARQALAALYEARAGAATGPRNTAYVQLAIAQWEMLQSDASARKQIAEDYFYLGLDAQARNSYADATAYYDKANALAPGGAGPLFTPERLTAQRRTLHLAWANLLLDQNDTSAALTKARAALGDRFMATFTPPLFYVTRAQVTTAGQTRTMAFTLAPLLVDETQNALSGVISSWRAAGADANIVSDGSNVLLMLTLPLQTPLQLRDQMRGLAKTLPDRAEWALARAVLSPTDIDWDEADEWLTHESRYREGVDLSPACRAFAAQLAPLAQSLKPLEAAAATDDEAQLKRALLKYAQRGWQSALANGRATYRSGAEESRVEPCATKTLASSSSAWRPERLALIIGLIELVGIAVLVARWRIRRQKPR
jgi:tetratricopeptide (TPR) repeat protein